MAIALVVIEPFADYVKGDRITDRDKVKELMETHRHHVVPISVDAESSKGASDT